jgi:hypothetical protein
MIFSGEGRYKRRKTEKEGGEVKQDLSWFKRDKGMAFDVGSLLKNITTRVGIHEHLKK